MLVNVCVDKHWSKLEQVRLSPHRFQRFGDILPSMFNDVHDLASFDWAAVAILVMMTLQVGTPKSFKTRPMDQATPTVDIPLKMWVKMAPEEDDSE
jgi:hypothetical protein